MMSYSSISCIDINSSLLLLLGWTTFSCGALFRCSRLDRLLLCFLHLLSVILLHLFGLLFLLLSSFTFFLGASLRLFLCALNLFRLVCGCLLSSNAVAVNLVIIPGSSV